MTITRDDLAVAFAHPNVKAFYMVVRKGESRLDDLAYRMVNGGPPITDFSRHPYAGMSTRDGGRAAGAPQFIPSTWAELANRYGFLDFSPPNQDLGYVGCLVKRDALDDVIAGRFDEAVRKCELEWTSLPGAAENNPRWDLEKARALYAQYGGTFADGTQPAAPIEERPQTETPQMPIAALIAAFGPMLVDMIPTIAKLFDKTTQTPAKVEAVTKVFDTIVKATGTTNVQQAIEVMQADPAQLKVAKDAVITEPSIMSLLVVEIGQGIEGARKADAALAANEKPFYKVSAVFWISLILTPMVMWYVGSSIVGGVKIPDEMPWALKFLLLLFGNEWDSGAKVGLANLVVGMILGGIVGVYYGVSVTQNKQQSPVKDQA